MTGAQANIMSYDMIGDLERLYNGLIWEAPAKVPGVYTLTDRFASDRKLSSRNNLKDISKLVLLYETVIMLQGQQIAETNILVKQMGADMAEIKKFMRNAPKALVKFPVPVRKISEILESMLLKAGNKAEETARKKNTLEKLLKEVGLTVDSDYSELHNVKTIEAISKNVIAKTDLKGDIKIKRMRYIKELLTRGHNIDPDNYRLNIIDSIPNIEKTRKIDKNPHLPYSTEQLLEMFDSKYQFFKDNPDVFFACLIAMFTGARVNAAVTLTYDDILVKDGIDCIQFIENHEIKKLKNEASERIVPVNPQLLEIGFIDYVRRRQSTLKAKGSDFIFPKCKTKGNKYNNKFIDRSLFPFLVEIGIKAKSGDSLGFHSYRKNANIGMEKAGISGTFINSIIGWEGKDTREQSYSNYTLSEIKEQVDRFSYDFLSDHFAKWKVIMSKK